MALIRLEIISRKQYDGRWVLKNLTNFSKSLETKGLWGLITQNVF
jgi:hypothetical protein